MSIGQAFGTLAGTTSDIGRLQQALGQADVSQLSQLGAMRQAQQQAGLDATRQNQMQSAQEPYTRLQLGSELVTRNAKCKYSVYVYTSNNTFC